MEQPILLISKTILKRVLEDQPLIQLAIKKDIRASSGIEKTSVVKNSRVVPNCKGGGGGKKEWNLAQLIWSMSLRERKKR